MQASARRQGESKLKQTLLWLLWLAEWEISGLTTSFGLPRCLVVLRYFFEIC